METNTPDHPKSPKRPSETPESPEVPQALTELPGDPYTRNAPRDATITIVTPSPRTIRSLSIVLSYQGENER